VTGATYPWLTLILVNAAQPRLMHLLVVRRRSTGGWIVISMKNDWKRIFAFE
jgi:hypothetical protein